MLTVNTTEGIEPQDAEIFFEEPPVRATDDRARALRAYLSGTFPERTERRSKHVMASEQQLVQNRNDSDSRNAVRAALFSRTSDQCFLTAPA